MAKVRIRRLWLNIAFDAPKNVKRDTIIRTLLRSIERGDYRYPAKWRVVLEWRNREDAEMKRAEFTAAMKDSARSSEGFDETVLDFLEKQL